jgi:hypothetical protein
MSDISETTSGFVRDLGEAARQNPLSAALIGMGVLWLFTGGRVVQRAGDLVERSGIDRIPDAAGEAFEKARSNLRSGAGAIGDGVTSAKDTLQEASADAIDTAARFGRQQADVAFDYARSLPNNGMEMFDTVRSNLTDVFKAQPLALGAIGLAIGAGIAAALPPSEIESEYFGETSAAAQAKVGEFASEQAERASTVAGNVVNAVAEEARKQGLTLEGVKAAATEVTDKVGRVVAGVGKGAASK